MRRCSVIPVAMATTICALFTITTPQAHSQGQLAAQATGQDLPLLGFSREHAALERALETRFDAFLNRDNMREWLKRLTARPHYLGSHYDKQNAEFIASLFRRWGYQTEIEHFKMLFPTPKQRLLEMATPTRFQVRLAEPKLKNGDKDRLPPYNAYSCDGDVTGQLIYANYGLPKDYETLAANGIEVKGKIVIARYGKAYRGVKPKVAFEHGAIGCVLFSDPHDDGYYVGDTWPEGPYRPGDSVQLGSVIDMPYQPGNPLVLGPDATPDAIQHALKNASTITKIPVLPISYLDVACIMDPHVANDNKQISSHKYLLEFIEQVHGASVNKMSDYQLTKLPNDIRCDFINALNTYDDVAIEIRTAFSHHKPFARELLLTYGGSIKLRAAQMNSLIDKYQRIAQPDAWDTLQTIPTYLEKIKSESH